MLVPVTLVTDLAAFLPPDLYIHGKEKVYGSIL
jgi:hypothetical protein